LVELDNFDCVYVRSLFAATDHAGNRIYSELSVCLATTPQNHFHA
jgi:hypothetical protein